MTESQKNAENAFNKFVDQYPIREEGQQDRSQSSAMIKAQSFSKPILPPLNIAKVKDDSQNVLAIKGFHDATRNQSSRSPHLSAGLSRVGATGEFNISVGDAEGSFNKGDSSRRDETPAQLKLRGIGNKLGDKDFLKDLPSLISDLNQEKPGDYYETFASNKGFLNTQDIFKLRESVAQPIWSCLLESKHLLLRGISSSQGAYGIDKIPKEEYKNKEEAREHNSILEDYLWDKMRLWLLNLLNIFIERYEISEYQGFFSIHNASSHPVNLFYCHLASNEMTYKIKQTYERLFAHKDDFEDELFDSDTYFNLDFDGKIHNQDEVIALDANDISNTSYIEHLLQGDSWKLQINNFSKSLKGLDNSEAIKMIQKLSVFKCSFSSEKVAIFKILQKVAICNEYTMKMQVENSLKYLSSYHESGENMNDLYGLGYLTRTQQPFQSMIGLGSPSKTMMNSNNTNSFDATGLNLVQRSRSGSQNFYWSNGIAYQGDRVNKEKLRRKSDMFLVRVMNSLCYKLGNLIPEDISWCEEINKDLLLLSQYISKVHSRISIFQIIDTVLNPLIAIKKILSDIIMKEKKGFHTGTGIIHSPFVNVESNRSVSNAQKSPNFNKFREASSNRKIEHLYEKAIRDLIAVYLDTLSSIFLKWKTQETYKMIWEIFIKDTHWQDSVQSYAMFLFRVDLMTESTKKMFDMNHPICLTNIEESILNKESISRKHSGLLREELKSSEWDKNLSTIKNILKEICGQARSVVHYYEWINILIRKALQDAKEKACNSKTSNAQSKFSEVVEEVGQEYEDDDEDEFNHAPSLEQEIDAEKENQNKLVTYWNKVQKRVLFTYAFLISPTNGIILEYLDNHGINHWVPQDSSADSPLEEIVPTSFLLTTSILKFWETLFTWAEKSLYNKVFTDELVLSFIRIHWVWFLILYNKGFMNMSDNAQFDNSREEFGIPNIQDFESHRYLKYEPKNLTTKDSLVTLWKLHLKCVWVLANNRSEVIRKNIFKFKILDFWSREIDLEWDERVDTESRQKDYFNTPQLITPPQIEMVKQEVPLEESYPKSDSSLEHIHDEFNGDLYPEEDSHEFKEKSQEEVKGNFIIC